jgi:uncharacterized membrane protein HdeD (DUF308 family)
MINQFRGGLAAAAAQVAALSLAIGLVFVVEGVVAILVAATHRRLAGWGWGLANGAITLLLGILILTMRYPLPVLGILVGVSFVFSGIDLLAFSARFHADESDPKLPPSPQA